MRVVAAVFSIVTLAPVFLNLLGLEFGSLQSSLSSLVSHEKGESALLEEVHLAMQGSYTHSILEWSAFCTAVFTAVLAYLHFGIRRDYVTPIIGMALLAAGFMDAFHTLAADRLITAVADNRNLIPFTWAISRTFNAMILLVGALIVLLWGRKKKSAPRFRNVLWVGFSFMVAAYVIIHFCAISNSLPETMFPEAMVTRPWDMIALVLFLVAGFFVFPRLHRQQKSHFSLFLWMSALPHITTQLHMTFGSAALFDNHFNVAHFLKIIAYLVPFCGLCFDYVQTCNNLKQTKSHLEQRNLQLTRSNEELDEFAYIASHDLKEPLRGVHNFAGFLLDDYAGKLGEAGVKKLKVLMSLSQTLEKRLDALGRCSRIGRCDLDLQETDLNVLFSEVACGLRAQFPDCETEARIVEPLPSLRCDRDLMGEVFHQLICNAFTFNDQKKKRVEIGAHSNGGSSLSPSENGATAPVIFVRDNGIGMQPKHADRIFHIFKRLQRRDAYGGGAGVGLTVVKKIINRHDGRIWLQSRPGHGTTVFFSI